MVVCFMVIGEENIRGWREWRGLGGARVARRVEIVN